MSVGGICLGDVDGDGLIDLYMAGAAGRNGLWLNRGGMRFTCAKLPAGAQGKLDWGTGAALVDIDNDGDLDLYQCNYDAPNQLFLNDGGGKFSEVPGAAGLDVRDSSLQASFADIDGDGDLDMFLLCNELIRAEGRPRDPAVMKDGVPVLKPEYLKYYKLDLNENGGYQISEYGRKDYLFLNQGVGENGQLRFRDVSREAGVQMEGWGLSSVWWDYDGDGDLDLYVANDFTAPDRLFRNDGVDGKGIPHFTDVAGDYFPHTAWSSMGSDAADINNDGLPDLMTAEMSATTHYKSKTMMGALTDSRINILTKSWPRQYMRNHLMLNTGAGMFQEAARVMGVSSSNWSWSLKFGDLDNDGYQDLFVTNGMSIDAMNADRELPEGDMTTARIGKTAWDLDKDTKAQPEKNLVFRNVGGKKFVKRPDWGLGLLGMSYSSAMGDLDNDGDLDLVVSDLGKTTKIYRNNSMPGGSLRVVLRGVKSNAMGIGARVVVTDDQGARRTRWQNPWTGYLSQNDTVLHFGLGKAKAEVLEVFWPSGTYQKVVARDKTTVAVTEAATGAAPVPRKPRLRFTKAVAPAFVHKEKPYYDFKLQPLLPQQLSQLGPCLAKGDADGDGDEDIYIGGAGGQEGTLWLNDKGTWEKSAQPAFGGLAKYAEDTAALWFDADGDKDLDLLIVTGSNEFEQGDTLYKDRLLLNTVTGGKALLTPAPDGAFPSLYDSGSCVTAADYDQDGDLDLFIGSRSVPGKYPMPPTSRLLRNDSAGGEVKFTEVKPKSFKNLGMVTDAAWADLDADNDPDLVVATDWGPVRIFLNADGKLSEISSGSGTSAYSGWWRSIHVVDVDADGDLDIVVGNTGLNTKYKQPSNKKPAMIYYGDMDGSGKPRIVEAKKGKDVHDRDRPLPVRGRF